VFYRKNQGKAHEDKCDTVGGNDRQGIDEDTVKKPEEYSGTVETYHEKRDIP
jgi:hypothetical protein